MHRSPHRHSTLFLMSITAPPPGKRTLQDHVLRAAQFLPSQGPITVFVHHNTLHAFEDLPFEEAILRGAELYGCQPYWSESRYRQELTRGRICERDLRHVMLNDLGDDADRLVASFGTRYALRMAMLQFQIQSVPVAELRWLMEETGALDRMIDGVGDDVLGCLIDDTFRNTTSTSTPFHRNQASFEWRETLQDESIAESSLDALSERQREKLTVRFLWKACRRGVGLVDASDVEPQGCIRGEFLNAPPANVDRLVDEVFVQLCGVWLDQGFASWTLPNRDAGLFDSFAQLFSQRWTVVPAWLAGLRAELKSIQASQLDAEGSVTRSLDDLNVPDADRGDFIQQSLLALSGWAGLMWQMESEASWAQRPAPAGTLMEFLAVRLILDRHASEHLRRQRRVGDQIRPVPVHPNGREDEIDQRCFTVFQIAQHRGWNPHELVSLSIDQWARLLREIDDFDSIQRRRVFHLAYEHHHRTKALDALAVHAARTLPDSQQSATGTPEFQLITCIDDREESFRRHLEEVHPSCETFGAAGFFGVVMYYRGETQAHYQPLCPSSLTPKHYVREEPVFSATADSVRRSDRRRLIGRLSQQVHVGSRTLVGGVFTGLLGSLASFPLVARILAPRTTARIRQQFGSLVESPATELHIERVAANPGEDHDGLGYSAEEMAGMVTRLLQDIGLTSNFAPLVFLTGHGSSSLNNPHESAYNCGACSGGRGGPNARSFASMANDVRVRKMVAANGVVIPDHVHFVGAYHNTCNDLVEYFDLDGLPRALREQFRVAESSINQARQRNAHERCRRFESAALTLPPDEALEHVEERAEDLSQARPEFNHATNSLCLVGRRSWSRGLFLDRRSFLVSYDPAQDDDAATILARLLAAAIPVCGGISLEYFFSTIDNEGYGCGSKLPHNIASLAGVMTGAASDLRPGLSAQMVEIHEPVRIMFVIETTPEIIRGVIDGNPAIARLVQGDWVQLALIDPTTSAILVYRDGDFVPHKIDDETLSTHLSSWHHYNGRRDHLDFATIDDRCPSMVNDASTGVIP